MSKAPSGKVRVALVENNERIAEPLQLMLERAREFECTGVSYSCEEALEKFPAAKPLFASGGISSQCHSSWTDLDQSSL